MMDYEFDEIWDIISQGKLTTEVRNELKLKIEEMIEEAVEEALWYVDNGYDA